MDGCAQWKDVLVKHHLGTVQRRIARRACSQKCEHTRYFLCDVSKVFCSGHGRNLADTVLAQHLPDARHQFFAECGVCISARRVEDGQGIVGVPCLYIMVDQFRDTLRARRIRKYSLLTAVPPFATPQVRATMAAGSASLVTRRLTA